MKGEAVSRLQPLDNEPGVANMQVADGGTKVRFRAGPGNVLRTAEDASVLMPCTERSWALLTFLLEVFRR